jgi:2-polyprenyl-3-methyl-5-hydroxy-6-metoxy-1,4-benzoquinol methylase
VDDSLHYPVEYYGAGAIRFRPLVESLIARARSARARAVVRAHPTPGAVLDVGCGRGLMLADLAARGWRTVGVEASDVASAHAREVLGLDVRIGELADCRLPAGSFEVVTLFHVLEHLEDPDATLSEVHRLLAPDGRLLLEVPNLGSLQARLSGGAWFHLDAPRHLHHFDRRSLLAALDRAGFKVLRLTTHSFEMGYFAMAQSLLNRATGRPNVLYAMLKNRVARPVNLTRRQLATTLALLLPAGLASVLLEAAAAVTGRGAVVRVIAQPR